jgi:hypothetical protein
MNQKSVQLWEYLLFTKPDDPDSGVYQRFIQLWKTLALSLSVLRSRWPAAMSFSATREWNAA